MSNRTVVNALFTLQGRLAAIGWGALLLMACGNTSPAHSPPASTNLDSGASGDSLDSSMEGGQSSDGGPGASGYRQGSNMCCGAGQGLTCCTADAGLLGYDVLSDGAIVAVGDLEIGFEANCFQYGGFLGACAGDGVEFDGKDPCVVCCAGLVRIHPILLGDAGPAACMDVTPPSIFRCVPCGNGVCDPDENRCTCPADCP